MNAKLHLRTLGVFLAALLACAVAGVAVLAYGDGECWDARAGLERRGGPYGYTLPGGDPTNARGYAAACQTFFSWPVQDFIWKTTLTILGLAGLCLLVAGLFGFWRALRHSYRLIYAGFERRERARLGEPLPAAAPLDPWDILAPAIVIVFTAFFFTFLLVLVLLAPFWWRWLIVPPLVRIIAGWIVGIVALVFVPIAVRAIYRSYHLGGERRRRRGGGGS